MYLTTAFIAATIWHGCAALVVPERANERQASGSKSNRATAWLPTYDYVVVGSGPGGGPVAARLAIAGYSVLLLEAGDDQGTSTEVKVPALQFLSTELPSTRWDYFVNHYSSLARQQQDSKMTYKTPTGSQYVGFNPPAGSTPLGILYPRAGTLGGCSSHNALITILPHDSDWSNIASITGDASWSPSNMRQYFIKLERNRYLSLNIFGHGYSGWLGTALTSVSLSFNDKKILSLLQGSLAAMGQSLLGMLVYTLVGLVQVFTQDINAPGKASQTGLYQVPLSISDSTRNGPRDFVLSTANALKPDGTRKYKLDIRLNAFVTKVRFVATATTPKAIGVDFLDGQNLYRADPASSSAGAGSPGSVNVTKEVILSAGAFNTPQILKLSGIGPASELTSFGIPVVADRPGVGTNLQDRYETAIVGKAPTDFVTTAQCTFLRTSPDPCLTQWQTGSDAAAKGPYASNGIALGVVRKSSVSTGEPDLFVAGGPANFIGYYPGYGAAALADAKHWVWVVLKAHSRNNAGTVKLRSADPLDTPLINFNSFDTGVTAGGADTKDVQAVYEGMEYSHDIFSSLLPLDGSFTETWPGQTNVSTEAQMKQFIKNEAWGHHASCTCPIGPASDPMAVLDSKFKVRGVQGLRVVDASVFPKIPGFYIALPVYMIAEKAADVIIQDAV